MAKYKLILSGWELEASAHSITKEEYLEIISCKEENDYNTYHDMLDELETILEDYFRWDGNIFTISCPFLYENDTYFSVLDENDVEVLSFKLCDINHDSEKFEEVEREEYDADPETCGHDYILFASDSNKGQIYGCEFESDEIPKIEDFDYLDNYINTPEGEIDILEEVYFKGEKLEKNFDYTDTRGKSSETDIFVK